MDYDVVYNSNWCKDDLPVKIQVIIRCTGSPPVFEIYYSDTTGYFFESVFVPVYSFLDNALCMVPVPGDEHLPPFFYVLYVQLKLTMIEAKGHVTVNQHQSECTTKVCEAFTIYIFFFWITILKNAFFCEFLINPELLFLEICIDNGLWTVFRCPEGNGPITFYAQSNGFPG